MQTPLVGEPLARADHIPQEIQEVKALHLLRRGRLEIPEHGNAYNRI